MIGDLDTWAMVCPSPMITVGVDPWKVMPISDSPALAWPEIMFVISPTASLVSWIMSWTSSPSMDLTTAMAHFLEKETEILPFFIPVKPMTAETSPEATLLVFTKGLPGVGSIMAMVESTLIVALIKGLATSTPLLMVHLLARSLQAASEYAALSGLFRPGAALSDCLFSLARLGKRRRSGLPRHGCLYNRTSAIPLPLERRFCPVLFVKRDFFEMVSFLLKLPGGWEGADCPLRGLIAFIRPLGYFGPSPLESWNTYLFFLTI